MTGGNFAFPMKDLSKSVMLQCCLLTNICSKLLLSHSFRLKMILISAMWTWMISGIKTSCEIFRKLLFLGEFAQQFATWFTFRWIFQWPFYGEIARDTLCYLMHCSSELYATQENIAEILWIVITSKLDCILCNKYFEDNIDLFFFFFETSWVWFCWQCAAWVLQKALSVTNFKCVFFFLFCGGGTWSASVSIK